jgi:hypothetical protein
MDNQSSFDIENSMPHHVGHPPSADSPVAQHNVASSLNNGAGDGATRLMPDSITGQNDLGSPLQSMNMNHVTETGGIDKIVMVGNEVNICSVFDQNNAPFGIEHPIPPLTNEITQGGLQHLGPTEQLSANIAGTTSVISQSNSGHSQ